MPTNGILTFRDAIKETSEYGFEKVRAEQQELGDRVRNLLTENGFKSDAAEGYQTPSVVVCYTDDSDIKNGKKFATEGVQIAAGVPLRCDEPEDFQTFRLGLFGLDKLHNIDRSITSLASAVDAFSGGTNNR